MRSRGREIGEGFLKDATSCTDRHSLRKCSSAELSQSPDLVGSPRQREMHGRVLVTR